MALQPTPGVAGGPIEVSAGLKRAISVDVTNKDDMLEIMPLGAGSEVGRSCHLASYRNKTVMFDCGVHPGYAGIASLPYFDEVDLSTVDAMLITHFHLDHCAAVPFVVGRTNFKGRILMTHPTKAIFAMLMQDFVKLNKQSENSEALFGEKDVAECMKRIEVIDFHQEMDIGGIKVTPYRAGHVLGACMFYVDIGGLRVLYTGDYSRTPDRHLPGADLPPVPPHVVIVEATYGVSPHSPREERERRFTAMVHRVLTRGGKVLLPVVALGRAQEVLLILEDYWVKHPELKGVPIYQASALAKRAMTVYQTYINVLNSDMKAQFEESNPFVFNHVNHLTNSNGLDGVGPCVVLATPSMLQSGLSRDLFESWCGDSKNGVIICDFAVQGTLAREILSDCKTVTSRTGQELPLRMTVDAISFSAHADYPQTQQFLDALAPPHVVLVHGEAGEMGKLKRALEGKATADGKKMMVYNPKNCQAVEIKHSQSKTARVMGKLALNPPKNGERVSGLLVQKDFGHMIIAPEDLHEYTRLKTAKLIQKQKVPTTQKMGALRFALEALFEGIHTVSSWDPDAAPEAEPEPKKLEEINAGEATEEAPASPTKATRGKKKAATSPAKGKKGAVKKEEPAEETVVKKEEAREGSPEPPGLSVNGGQLTILKRPETKKYGAEHALLQWDADPMNDMIADAVLSVILQLEDEPEHLTAAEAAHKRAMKNKDVAGVQTARLRIVAAMLGVQFGEPRQIDEEAQVVELRVENTDVAVRYGTRDVDCEDAAVKARVETALERIDVAIADSSFSRALPSVSGVSAGADPLKGT